MKFKKEEERNLSAPTPLKTEQLSVNTVKFNRKCMIIMQQKVD